jgi:NAD(P)-dependent dehydrogenase (short-subunit alcohol dehydrogenase family)
MSTQDYQQQALRFQPQVDLLQGRVIAISGAGDGIGRALALSAVRHGAEVVLIGRTVKRLEAVYAEISAIRTDAASIAPLNLEQAIAADYDQLAAAISERYGRLDGLVHNAAILGGLTAIEHYDVPMWCRVLHVNLTAAFVLTQVLLPALRMSKDASIIFTSSGVGRRPRSFWGAYAVSKCGVEGLSALLAEELAEGKPIRVNACDGAEPELSGAAAGACGGLSTLASSDSLSSRQRPRGSERSSCSVPMRVRRMRLTSTPQRSSSWRIWLPLAPWAIS